MAKSPAEVSIVFGTNRQATDHAFRHIDACGVSRDWVRQAIVTDLEARLSLPPSVDNVPFKGAVTVAGIPLTYHAFTLSSGVVNLGRITPQ